MSWQTIATAPENKPVETAIIEDGSERLVQVLVRVKRLWFFEDKTMYVYYSPTHWRPAQVGGAL